MERITNYRYSGIATVYGLYNSQSYTVRVVSVI